MAGTDLTFCLLHPILVIHQHCVTDLQWLLFGTNCKMFLFKPLTSKFLFYVSFTDFCFSEGMTLHAFLIKTDNLMAEWALISTLLTFKLDLHCHMELFGIQYKTLFLSLFFFSSPFQTTNCWEIIVEVLKRFSNDCLLVQYNFFLSPGLSPAPFWGPVYPPVSAAHTQQAHSVRVGLSAPLCRSTWVILMSEQETEGQM